jgi:hypothetical protein
MYPKSSNMRRAVDYDQSFFIYQKQCLPMYLQKLLNEIEMLFVCELWYNYRYENTSNRFKHKSYMQSIR